MKKLTAFLILMAIVIVALSQETPSQKDFSNNSISIGVVVADLQKSIDFYTNVIGMTKTGGFSVDDNFTKRSGLNSGMAFDVTVLKLEDDPQAPEWKLMSFNRKPTHPWQKYMTDDNGIQYVTIFVNSMNPILERINKNNVRLLSEPGLKLEDGRSFVLIQDPDGTFIELIGPE
ncbi:MAG: VOC family protein [Prolixibacteraceae bacterium]|nr:VOC family protein [Prolixibacteraceae bacterium]MBN2774896.1 VOC family protein [Prolixibacteraceae bacterium]